MNLAGPLRLWPLSWLMVVFIVTFVKAQEPDPSSALPLPRQSPLTVDEARQQAEVLHESLHATLQVVHHQYYREDEGLPIPAATLKKVFQHLERDRKIEIRWLAGNAQAMNVDHAPKTDFEKEAVKALATGKAHVEQVEEGIYRHVGPIVLQSECLKCHLPSRKSNKDRLAALLIAIPVIQD